MCKKLNTLPSTAVSTNTSSSSTKPENKTKYLFYQTKHLKKINLKKYITFISIHNKIEIVYVKKIFKTNKIPWLITQLIYHFNKLK